MATREIEESEFVANVKLRELYGNLLRNPKSREKLEAAIREIDPNAATPLTDAKAEIRDEIAKEREARLALEKQIADEKAEREAQSRRDAFANSWEKQKAGLRAEGYTDEGIAEIEKLAEERGIPDLEAAEALFRKRHPPTDVSAPTNGYGSWNLFEPTSRDDEQFKKLLDTRGEDEIALRRMIDGTLTELRGGVRK